jgi:hypothetical protein
MLTDRLECSSCPLHSVQEFLLESFTPLHSVLEFLIESFTPLHSVQEFLLANFQPVELGIAQLRMKANK